MNFINLVLPKLNIKIKGQKPVQLLKTESVSKIQEIAQGLERGPVLEQKNVAARKLQEYISFPNVVNAARPEKLSNACNGEIVQATKKLLESNKYKFPIYVDSLGFEHHELSAHFNKDLKIKWIDTWGTEPFDIKSFLKNG